MPIWFYIWMHIFNYIYCRFANWNDVQKVYPNLILFYTKIKCQIKSILFIHVFCIFQVFWSKKNVCVEYENNYHLILRYIWHSSIVRNKQFNKWMSTYYIHIISNILCFASLKYIRCLNTDIVLLEVMNSSWSTSLSRC